MLIGTDHDIKPVSSPSVATDLSEGHLMALGLEPLRSLLCKRVISDIAPTEIPVLLIGESGTGKEIAALEIHRLSNRSSEPFVKCNCAAQGADSPPAAPAWLRENGATDETGRNGGTIFLDEVSLLDPASQLALLHCLPDGQGMSSGGRAFARVISSTTREISMKKCAAAASATNSIIASMAFAYASPRFAVAGKDIAVLLPIFLR